MNEFVREEEHKPKILKINPKIAAKQIQRLRQMKAERNNEAVASALQRLKDAAAGTENLMPHILNAVESYATVGEISDALREVFGEYV
ncbi:MAG: hypothetical protein D6732_17710 [Methanobacteriota archaeon]|nr:MAG: hypothetical protein D6732_17710 [Euryarchaeota archaeon]